MKRLNKNKELLFLKTPNSHEERTEIRFVEMRDSDLKHFIGNHGIILSRFNYYRTKYFGYGSGYVIKIDKFDKPLILSCGHNFILTKKETVECSIHSFTRLLPARFNLKEYVLCDSSTLMFRCYTSNWGKTDLFHHGSLCQIEKAFLKKKYLIPINQQAEKGYDLCVAFLENQFELPDYVHKDIELEDESEIKINDEIVVVGYPGEYANRLYYMHGNISKIDILGSKRIIYYYNNIKTSKGQSGSPVFRKKDSGWSLIGVHVAHCPSHGPFATGFTKHTIACIKDIVKREIEKKEKKVPDKVL